MRIGGRDVTRLPPHARDTGMVFQSYALYPHKTVAENIGFPLKMAKRPRAEIDTRVRATAEMLRLVQLEGLAARRPDRLALAPRDAAVDAPDTVATAAADADDVVKALLATGDSPEPPENPMSADRVRWEHIQRVYELCGRNVSETARRLNMHRRTLQRILA